MLIERGVEVTVIAPRDRTFEPLTAMGCRCIELPVASKGTNPRDDLRTLVALYRQYRDDRPHVVFHYTIKPNIYGSIAAKLAGVPSIAVTTGLGYVFIQKSRAAARREATVPFRVPFSARSLVPESGRPCRVSSSRTCWCILSARRLLHGEGVDLDEFALRAVAAQRDGLYLSF